MKVEDIEVGKWYYWKFAYGTKVSKVLAKNKVDVVMGLGREPYSTLAERVIAEAEEPKVEPVTIVSAWQRIKRFLVG